MKPAVFTDLAPPADDRLSHELALAFDAVAGGHGLRLCLAGTARHAADAALALQGCEDLLDAVDAWCGDALDWRWEPLPGGPSTDTQLALDWQGGFVQLRCTWAWLRALPPPPAALASRLHWPPVPAVVCAGLLRLHDGELRQLEPGGAVVLPMSMAGPWAGALRGLDEAPDAGVALEIGTPEAPRRLPRRAALAAAGGGDALCELRLAAPAALPGGHLVGWHDAELDLRAFDARASLWRCAGAAGPAQRLATGQLLPWGDGHMLLLETVEAEAPGPRKRD